MEKYSVRYKVPGVQVMHFYYIYASSIEILEFEKMICENPPESKPGSLSLDGLCKNPGKGSPLTPLTTDSRLLI